MDKYIGLDLGSSSLKAVIIDEHQEIMFKTRLVHHGRVEEALEKLFHEIENQNIAGDTGVMVTGVHAGLVSGKNIQVGEIPAIERGVQIFYPKAKSALDIGAQNVRYLTGLGTGKPPQFAVNESCAGGTGSFFEDQMYRLGLRIEDYSKIISKAETIPRLSGRCSVFAKTDIIHRQQEGVSTPDILLGLCYATIRNLKATIIKNLPISKPFALCGGILYNEGVVKAVCDIFNLNAAELYVDMDGVYIPAAGAAVLAMEKSERLVWKDCKILSAETLKTSGEDTLPPLSIYDRSVTREPICAPISENTGVSLGIDVGSTSTNLVLIDYSGNLLDFQYLRTRGESQTVVRQGLQNIYEKYGDKLCIESVGVTGSGRHLIGKMVGADVIRDEITAQAQAAVSVDEHTDTVFEIGGQDSKYIQIEHGTVKDFQMNKICAAGTGSFLEEQANRLDVQIEEYGELALQSKNPARLGERCTVFIESSISACQSRGVSTEDILAGLCHSVIQNYLFKVVYCTDDIQLNYHRYLSRFVVK